MNNNFKSINLIGKFIAFSLFVFNTPLSFAETYKNCGIIFPLTGFYSVVGNALKNGATLALEDFNKEQKVKFIFEDDQFQARLTVGAFNNLVNKNSLDCLIIFGSSTSLSIANQLESKKIPTIVIAVSPKVKENKKYMYQLYASTDFLNTSITEEVKRKAYKTIALVSTTHDSAHYLKKAFLNNPPAKILLDEEVNLGDPEMRSIATKIKGLKPDAVYFNLLTPQVSILAKNLRQLDYPGDFFGWTPMGLATEIEAAQGALKNAWYADLDDQKESEFIKRYEKTYQEVYNIESIYGYESVKNMILAIKSGDINNYLENTKTFSGLIGDYELKDRSFLLPTTIKVVE